jgi:hypothetical protein
MKGNVACLGDMLRNASGLSIQDMKHINTEPILTQHFITAKVIGRVCHISTFSRNFFPDQQQATGLSNQ